jgi:hypothetical protein
LELLPAFIFHFIVNICFQTAKVSSIVNVALLDKTFAEPTSLQSIFNVKLFIILLLVFSPKFTTTDFISYEEFFTVTEKDNISELEPFLRIVLLIVLLAIVNDQLLTTVLSTWLSLLFVLSFQF